MKTEIKIHDGVFDKKWVDDLAYHLSTNVSWIADNIAGRNSWPYGHHGTHRLMGRTFYRYKNRLRNIYFIKYWPFKSN